MKIVPLSPLTMVRAPGWPCDQTSALKPFGSLSLSTGSLSSAVTVGGVGCGLRLVSCLLSAGLVLSSGLKPGGAWATAGPTVISKPSTPASSMLRRYDRILVMHSSLFWKLVAKNGDVIPRGRAGPASLADSL